MKTIREIQQVVCAHYSVTLIDLISKRRCHGITLPRHIAMWMARHLTQHSLPEIGRAFGNRDHSTITYAIERVDNLMRNDRAEAVIIWALVESMNCAESVEMRRNAMRIVA